MKRCLILRHMVNRSCAFLNTLQRYIGGEILNLVSYSDFENKLYTALKRIPINYKAEQDAVPLDADKALKSKLFDFYGESHATYAFALKQAKDLLSSMIEDILIQLYENKEITATGDYNTSTGERCRLVTLFKEIKAEPLFCVVTNKGNARILFLFKEFGCHYVPRWFIEQIVFRLQITKYHYVSMVEECSYAAVSNHNSDTSDRSRGTNDYSFKDYFISEFGESEYIKFREFSNRATQMIKNYMGFSIVKSLTPQALFNFKQVVDKEICSFDYCGNLLGVVDQSCIDRLNTQFFGKKYYMAVLSDSKWQNNLREYCLFSESFLTAEWLKQSLPTNGRTDLTVVALGYFKAIEELLFAFVTCYAGEKDKWIDTYNMYKDATRNSSYKQGWQSYLMLSTLSDKKEHIMLERMISFISDFDDLFTDISAKNTLLDLLRSIKPLRNGFFHKDNLHDISIVEEARKSTFLIFYLLLGSMRTTANCYEILGIPENEDHFQMLCGYVDQHVRSAYYLDYGDGKLSVTIGQNDKKVQYDQAGNAVYSGVYFNLLIDFPISEKILTIASIGTMAKEKLCFNSKSVPHRIYKGTLVPCAEGFDLAESQTLIWENGVFMGDHT